VINFNFNGPIIHNAAYHLLVAQQGLENNGWGSPIEPYLPPSVRTDEEGFTQGSTESHLTVWEGAGNGVRHIHLRSANLRRLGDVGLEPGDKAFKDQQAVGAAENLLAGALGMGHQAGHVAGLVADAGDVAQGTVGVGLVGWFASGVDILPEDLTAGLEFFQGGVVAEITALAVGNGKAQEFAFGNFAGERAVVRGGLEENVLATKLQGAVADQGAGQETGFAQDLKSIADAQHRAALRGKGLHGLHDGAETGNRAGAQIIAVAEAAGNDHGVKAGQGILLVPEQPDGMAEHVLDDMEGVLIAIGGGELQDGEVHASISR